MAKGGLTLEQNERSWVYFFIDRFKLTMLVAVFLFLGGAMAFMTLPKELQPEVEIPVAYVIATYPGASPEDVENLVTKELEEKIEQLEGLDTYSSVTGAGYAQISVEFLESEDVSDAIQKLREKVDEAKGSLPSGVDDPSIQQYSFDTIPILTVVLSGPYEPSELRGWAEDLQDEIKTKPNVQDVFLNGAPEARIEVVPDIVKMLGEGLTVYDLVSVISGNNLNFPLGNLEMAGFEWSFRTAGRYTSLEQIKELPLRVVSETGQVVKVQDVATVQNGFSKMETYSRYAVAGSEPENTVSLTVTKGSGGDITDMSNEIKDLVADVSKSFPSNVKLEIAQDYSKFIEDDFKVLTSSGLQTVLLVFLTLFFFMGWKSAFFASMIVPFSILFGLWMMQMMGFSLNTLSLFSLILTLGMLVDNGIVVQEGVHHYRKRGIPPVLAAKMSVRDFKWPLIAGTTTTMSAFVPMLITPGIIGQFIRVIPIVVTMVLLGSILSALILNTSFSAYFMKTDDHKDHWFDLSKYLEKLGRKYREALAYLIVSRKRRWASYVSAVVLFMLAFALPVTGILGIQMFGGGDYDYFYVEVTGQPGQVLDTTDGVIREIEKQLLEVPELKNFVSYTGSMAGGEQTGEVVMDAPHLGSISVNLVEERERKTSEIVEELRQKTAYLQDQAKVVFKTEEGGPPSSAPVYIRIFGDDLNELRNVTSDFKKMLYEISSATDVSDTVEVGKGQYTFTFDKYQLARLGVSSTGMSYTLRAMVDNWKVTEVWQNDEKREVVVTFDEDDLTLDDLLNTTFTTATGEKVAFRDVVSVKLEPEYSTIKHYDGQKMFAVSSSVADGHTATEVLSLMEEKLKDYKMPSGYSYTFGGEAEDINESFSAMFKAFGIAVLLIAMILVLQFDSFKQPFIIMITIPLSLIGVFPGLTLMHLNFSFPAIIGVVALAGIVVNNAIILIDRINSLVREHGFTIREASLQAGFSRLQPIVLTSFTTIVGIMPLAFSQPIWAPLAYSICFGLMVTTFLTLFYIPMMYVSLEEGKGNVVPNEGVAYMNAEEMKEYERTQDED